MRILITGGTGLIGQALLKNLLLNDDLTLVVLSRRPSPFTHKKIIWHQVNLCDQEILLDQLLESVDCVIHGAAQLQHQNSSDFLASAYLNFSFTTLLFKKAVEYKIEKLIYLSGFNFLRKPLSSVITETHPIGPTTPYAISKYWGEIALFAVTKDSNTAAVSLRITSPLTCKAADLHDTVIKKWIVAAENKQPLIVFGQGSRLQDYVSTIDIARAIVLAVRMDANGVFNIASGSPISNIDVANLIAARYGVEIEHYGTDPEDGDIWKVSITKACEVLGYIPTWSSEDCIRKLLADS